MIKVPITCAFDQNMILPAKVCLFSLLHNALNSTSYDVFVLYKANTISPIERQEVEEVFKESRHRIAFVNVGNVFDNCFQIRGITTVTYYRIIVPHVIGEINATFNTAYDRIIYLDVDTIVECDYGNLYKTFQEDNDFWIAGVRESPLYWINELPQYLIESGVDAEGYINAGFLVMNISNLVKNHFFELCKEHLGNEYFFQDQDIINLVCNKHKVFIPLKYNFTALLYDKANVAQDKAFIEERREDLLDVQNAMIHYTGPKPWNEYVRRGNIWWYYYQKSPFYDSSIYIKHFLSIDHSLVNKSSGKPLLKALIALIKRKMFK